LLRVSLSPSRFWRSKAIGKTRTPLAVMPGPDQHGVLWVSAVTLHPSEHRLERWQTPSAMARASGEARADFSAFTGLIHPGASCA